MRRCWASWVVVVLIGIWGMACSARELNPAEVQKLMLENKDKIPPLVAQTLPPGATWKSHMYARNYGLETRVDMEYSAAKPNPGEVPLHPNTDYRLKCHVITPGDPICEMMAKNYLPQEFAKLKSLAKVESEPSFQRTATERDTPWGKSLRVRVEYTPMGQGSQSPKSITTIILPAGSAISCFGPT